MKTFANFLLAASVVALCLFGPARIGLGQDAIDDRPRSASDSPQPGERSAKLVGIALLALVAGAGVLLWNRRRTLAADPAVRLVAMRALGPKERIAVLEISGERLVLGVTPHRVSLLARRPAMAAPDGSTDKGSGR
jgi:flagellar biogenesis protein FliO